MINRVQPMFSFSHNCNVICDCIKSTVAWSHVAWKWCSSCKIPPARTAYCDMEVKLYHSLSISSISGLRQYMTVTFYHKQQDELIVAKKEKPTFWLPRWSEKAPLVLQQHQRCHPQYWQLRWFWWSQSGIWRIVMGNMYHLRIWSRVAGISWANPRPIHHLSQWHLEVKREISQYPQR